MKKKIDCMFIRNRNVVGFTIFDMDDRFRGHFRGHSEYESSNGFSIISSCNPEIASRALYLRGSSSYYDRDIVQMRFKTEEDAKKYISRAIEALKDWAKNCPAFEEDKQKTENDKDNIITHVVI